MKHPHSAIFTLHLTVIVMGATGVFARTIDLPAWEITGIRTLMAALLLVAWVGITEGHLGLKSAKDYSRMGLLGVLLGAHWVTYFHAMQVSSVAIGMIAFFTYPTMTVLLEPLFNRIRLNWRDAVSAGLVLLGVYFLVPEFSLDNDMTWGVVWGLISALLFALRNILLGHWFKEQTAARSLGYQTAVTALLLLPFIFAKGEVPATEDIGLLILLGVVFTAVAHTLLGYTLRLLRPKTVGLVSCMQPVYGVIYAALLLGDIPTVTTVVGGCLISLAAFYETLQVRQG
ncbi:DMT family transporter [Gilvimarinus sp. SDUM040013]|uniref:DMT family transporter n=1 Tax=Gilvimarinus gilvus TaxID=3058038 RepID=A0ABU4RT08_9GAMM|nr:DMT family transporter [Gilvimarinus sp. SDUM040013]MDO3387081.1 DMT family transporter [Gilvimarinus sp. SDUM040013]MDX6848024.1 DMT family transporter [Gilvimarinus sp. SDUM040013]